MKVSNFESPNGNNVANQFLIESPEKTIFQSYDKIIAVKEWDKENFCEKITLDEKYWNYSKTTSKYRSDFLGESTKETRSKINQGIYKLANLN